jgi:oligopeptide/dipeptide ABC transporter ATP-binding protein
MEKIIEINNLTTVFKMRKGTLTAIDNVSLSVNKGEIVGLVGESGSGKSVTGLSIMGLVDPPGFIEGGQILFDGQDITRASETTLRDLRGRRMSLIFQDATMALNPVLKIQTHIVETVRAHQRVSTQKAKSIGIDALRRLGIPEPEKRLKAYPHQFSGGMCQRVTIALAILHDPDFIIADEPTTALDVTIQEQILYEMKLLCSAKNVGMLWITHDLSVVGGLADKIYVMYGGRIVEHGPTDDIIEHPCHPYTKGLIDSLPEMTKRGEPLKQIKGTTVSLIDFKKGCAFKSRCGLASEVCDHAPQSEKVAKDHWVACHNFDQGKNLVQEKK